MSGAIAKFGQRLFWKHWPLLERRSSLTHRRLILRRLCRVFCANSPTSRSFSPSLRPKSVQVGPIVRGNVGTPTTSSMRAEGLQEETFLMSSILSTFVFLYVSSSLDSLTLRSGVLGEERQVTVFAVRASRYPTQRGGGGEHNLCLLSLLGFDSDIKNYCHRQLMQTP